MGYEVIPQQLCFDLIIPFSLFSFFCSKALASSYSFFLVSDWKEA